MTFRFSKRNSLRTIQSMDPAPDLPVPNTIPPNTKNFTAALATRKGSDLHFLTELLVKENIEKCRSQFRDDMSSEDKKNKFRDEVRPGLASVLLDGLSDDKRFESIFIVKAVDSNGRIVAFSTYGFESHGGPLGPRGPENADQWGLSPSQFNIEEIFSLLTGRYTVLSETHFLPGYEEEVGMRVTLARAAHEYIDGYKPAIVTVKLWYWSVSRDKAYRDAMLLSQNGLNYKLRGRKIDNFYKLVRPAYDLTGAKTK